MYRQTNEAIIYNELCNGSKFSYFLNLRLGPVSESLNK